ncbi:TPA: hypothetical protein ACJITD_003214 [Legionella pneumophila]|uniref:hypothetical protein n=1 Tax=Legionella pneumophila TaxID=446 RepID=UPI001374B6A3|nr:hypothetical protein [Legionella pneumophila]HAT1875068.1 hypothetical protein [Legionella pneumophila]HAT2058839.1 hypothetical protein [Legionella pneumophila]HAT2073983.1 hypothetical protein [Legionella pneumophila]HAT7923700.1 hypothetical protein [Legionella pneumophila]HAT8311364.1 hypothetical protein [Legionella pneumophila]
MRFFEDTSEQCYKKYKKLVSCDIAERVTELNKLQPNFQSIDFKREQSVHVGVGECAFINVDSEKRMILGSAGAGPCFILAIVDSDNKSAWLAHIDFLVSMQQLQDALKNVYEKINPKSAVAHIVGGNDASIAQGIAICNELEQNGVTIGSALLRQKMEIDQLSLAVDPKTGTIYAPEGIELAERKDSYQKLGSRLRLGNQLGSIELTDISPLQNDNNPHI